MAAVGIGNEEAGFKYGFIDQTGKEVIPLKYKSTSGFKSGMAKVELNGETFYINKLGSRIK